VPLVEALREDEGSNGGEPLVGLQFRPHNRPEVGVNRRDPVDGFDGHGQLVPSEGGEAVVGDDWGESEGMEGLASFDTICESNIKLVGYD
jgi:hypothetical protein